SKYKVARLAALLRAQAPERAARVLRDLLAGGSADLRAAALEALAALPGGLDQKTLHRLLRDGDPGLQIVAAATLRRMDDPSGLPVLLELVARTGGHRAEAVEALGGFCTREVVEPLLNALDDGDVLVRERAWDALYAVLGSLFPYRHFDFPKCGYDPNAASRQAGIAQLRAWWATVK
ncbi:MAG: HEAT repeat domain-containing protein, partial [Planctomycetes bacterium]|nr:HEAT repeat domain-containing protein [Planctomycetota bacterium]